MGNQNLVTIFWSGGFKSTFRMLELAQTNAIVQPIFITDKERESTEYERSATKQILPKLRMRAKAQIMDVICYDAATVDSACRELGIRPEKGHPLSEADIHKIMTEEGWQDIMRMTWFCENPINEQPCGLCSSCNDALNGKMEWLMPDVSLNRWKHRGELLAMADGSISNVEKRIAQHIDLYKKVTGRDLDLLHPHNLNEKLQWLMVYRYDRNVSRFADKLAVRDYVKQCGYEDILTRIYGVWKSGAEVDKTVLPKKYALKCNHGSGEMFYALCRGDANADEAIAKLDKALSYDYAYVGYEYHYSYIEPKIYAEELLENMDGSPLVDYKFFCFGGVPRFVKVIADRASGKHQDYYDMDWNFCPMVKDEITMGGGMNRPDGFERMKEIAAKLSEPFPMARVDLYCVDGRVFFGEITLTPATGLNRTDKPETLEMLGKLVDVNNFRIQSPTILTAGRRILSSGIISTMSRSDLNSVMQDCVRILNSDGSNELKEIYMNILYRAAFRDDMSLEECWQIFRDIDRAMFVNYALKLWDNDGNTSDIISSAQLRRLYGLIFDFVQSRIDYSGKEPVKGDNIAVVLTSQLLKIGHAPTRRVLDYSYALQHDLGYRVIIVNDGGMHYYHSETLGDDIEFTFLDEYTNMASIGHKGERFELLQVSALMPDLAVMQQLVDMIYELKPAFVYNIGASSPVADLCDPFVPVYALACNSNLPVSMCSNLLLCRELGTLGRVEGLRPYQNVIETVYNFTFAEAQQEYEVGKFLPEKYKGAAADGELFLAATIGYRIGTELDEAFVTMLGCALNKVENMIMFIVGEVREDAPIREVIARAVPKDVRDRLVLTGGMQGASGFFKHMQLVLNPDRSGGGRSIFEANHYGIPTVSLRKGDGYYSGGMASGADDYGEYLRLIEKYATDREFYDKRSREAAERANSLEDIAGTLKKVVER